MNASPQKPVPEVSEAARPYWEAAQRGELVFQRCRGTGKPFLYPRHWSPFDFSADPTWEKASGRGTVYSYTIVHQPPYAAFKADCPYVMAIVQLEEGPRLMTNILNCDPATVKIGMAVKLCFETRAGGFRIPQFEPA
ncbi:MAG: Zn-ribbon domain-containing OB-fold protein [Panacagrimonas sp.]